MKSVLHYHSLQYYTSCSTLATVPRYKQKKEVSHADHLLPRPRSHAPSYSVFIRKCHSITFWKGFFPFVSIVSPWHPMILSKSHLLIVFTDLANPALSPLLTPYQSNLFCAFPFTFVSAPKIFVKIPDVGLRPVLLYCSTGG